jgi:hypothetical protein
MLRNARGPIRVTPSTAAGEGKKTGEGTMMSPLESNSKSDPVAVADPRNAKPELCDDQRNLPHPDKLQKLVLREL